MLTPTRSFLGASTLALIILGGLAISYAQQSDPPTTVRPATPSPKPKPMPGPPAKPQSAVKQPEAKTPDAAPQDPNSTSPVAEPVKNSFEENIKKAGISTCKNTLSSLFNATLPPQSTYQANIAWDKAAANAHSVQAVIGIQTGDLNIGGILLASPLQEKCEGQFIRITPVNTSCATVALSVDRTGASALGRQPVIAKPDGTQIMLLDAGPSVCVAVLFGRMAG